MELYRKVKKKDAWFPEMPAFFFICLFVCLLSCFVLFLTVYPATPASLG